MIGATVACALACAVLMIAEVKHWRTARGVAKVIASLSFLIAGILAWHGSDGDGVAGRFALLIVVGQAFGVVGDVALLGDSTARFLAGLGAFLVGHVAYVIGILAVVKHSPSIHAWALVALPVIGGALALRWLWRHLDRVMTGPVIAYVVTIAAMVGAALIAATGDALSCTGRGLLVAAAVLFFVSDLAVARERFVIATVGNHMWGAPAYFCAQLLFAWSIATAT
jgi:uncharacterized membrane protein YhhN